MELYSKKSLLPSSVKESEIALLRRARSIPGYERHPEALSKWVRLHRQHRRSEISGIWHYTFVDIGEISDYVVPTHRRDKFVVARGCRCLRVFDVASGKFGLEIPVSQIIDSLALDPTGELAVVTLREPDTYGERVPIRVYDLTAGRILDEFTVENSAAVSFLPNSRFLLFGWRQGGFSLFDRATRRIVREHSLPDKRYEADCVGSPTECIAAFFHKPFWGKTGRSLEVWDLAGKKLVVAYQHPTAVWAAAFAPFSQSLVSCTENMLYLWNLETGQCIHEIHIKHGFDLDLSADGRHALVGFEPVEIVDLEAGRVVYEISEVGRLRVMSTLGNRVYSFSDFAPRMDIWRLDWELEEQPNVDWHGGAIPFLERFLTEQTPFPEVPIDRPLFDEDISTALTRRGVPSWDNVAFDKLWCDLQCAGYGWLRPETVRSKLEIMASRCEPIC
jgi:WD40 repeat protein